MHTSNLFGELYPQPRSNPLRASRHPNGSIRDGCTAACVHIARAMRSFVLMCLFAGNIFDDLFHMLDMRVRLLSRCHHFNSPPVDHMRNMPC